eukprot:15406_1
MSNCLQNMLSNILTLKLRTLRYWSSAMSIKLFSDLSLHLKNRLLFWKIYETYYTKTIWKSIIIKLDDDNNDEDIEQLNVNIPCQPCEYIHHICFKFIEVLLMIISQDNVPNSIIGILENEFRLSTSKQLNQIFKQFFINNNNNISESLGLQFYFD